VLLSVILRELDLWVDWMGWRLSIVGFFAIAALAGNTGGRPIQSAKAPLGDRYLLLVNTAVASMMTPDKIAQFDKSSYDGLAIAFLHAYDTSPVPSPEDMDAKIAGWKKNTTKNIWPWVYINRMLAIDPADKNPYSKDPYFRRFSGADLDGHAGARSDFLQNWSNALRAARDSSAPGIVCDLEFYNYQRAYEIPELAAQIGQTPEQTVELLRQLGARMADSAAAQYPDATLWFLFTGLTHPDYKIVGQKSYYPSPAYIAIGLLDEIQTKHLGLKVLTGGEGSLGYCHLSIAEFREKIRERGERIVAQLRRYEGILELAGTMTLWSEPAAKKAWLKEYPCGSASAATVEDLQPYLELLLRSYRYNWIYGSADGGYYAFLPESARRFDAVISRSKAPVTGSPAR
jgi:hypothetical protein